ncbi:MAG: flagellar hook-length control protein FliK [Pseudomonadota bacterium]
MQVTPTISAATTGVAAAGSTNQISGSGNPFAMLLSLLGGDQAIALPLTDGQSAGDLVQGSLTPKTVEAAKAAFDQDVSKPVPADAEAVLADILSQLEAGQPFDAEMLDQLAETGLVSPELIGRLETALAASTTTTLALPGKTIDGSTTQSADPIPQQNNPTDDGSQTEDATTRPRSDQGGASQNPEADNNQVAAAAGATTAVIDDASEDLLPRAVQTAATETSVLPKPEVAPTDVKKAENDQPPLRPDVKPAVDTERRRIGGERPAGFLTSLSEGQSGQGASFDAQANSRDALTELRAALQRNSNSPAASQTAAAAADMALSQDIATSLQDFDLQLGGRTLDALTANGTPKSVTVTSNGTQLPTHQLALTIATEARAGTRRFEIRLDPPEMGRIDVKLESRADGSVRSVMTIERPETFDALNRDARHIERLLQQSGLKLEDGGLQLAMGGRGGDTQGFAGLFGDGGQNQRTAGGTVFDRQAVADEDAAIAAIASAGDGGVDIRI